MRQQQVRRRGARRAAVEVTAEEPPPARPGPAAQQADRVLADIDEVLADR